MMRTDNTKPLPEFVNILNSDGSIRKMSYKNLKNHEESIIEDNIGYGLLHSEYPDKEINDYEKQAKAEWKNLKHILREAPTVLLELDQATERYVAALTEVK